MRTYAARVDGTAYESREIPAQIQSLLDGPLLAIYAGRSVPVPIAAILVALGLIETVPASPN